MTLVTQTLRRWTQIVCLGITASISVSLSPALASPIPPSPLLLGQTSPNINRQTFFETGRPRSEDTLIFRSPPSGVPALRPNASNWQFIIFKEGNVSFWIPPGLLTQDQVILETTVGEISFKTLVSTDGDYRYIAAYAANLTPDQVNNPAAILTAIRSRVAPPETFSLMGERPISWGDNTGMELVFQNDTDTITLRTFLVGDRLYGVGVVQPTNSPRDRAARAFLNAPQLLDAP